MTATQTLTFEKVIAENRETLDYFLGQDDVTALTPADLVDELADAGSDLSDSFESGNQANGEALTAAATYLADALRLSPDDPDMPVLLSRAQKRLLDADI